MPGPRRTRHAVEAHIVIRYLLLAATLLLATPVHAGEWSLQDTQRQSAYLVLHTLDWSQTRWMVRNDHEEVNPIMGRSPSVSEVDRYFVATAVLHTVISYHLSPPWRKRWQRITIAVEATTVAHNANVGVRIEW